MSLRSLFIKNVRRKFEEHKYLGNKTVYLRFSRTGVVLQWGSCRGRCPVRPGVLTLRVSTSGSEDVTGSDDSKSSSFSLFIQVRHFPLFHALSLRRDFSDSGLSGKCMQSLGLFRNLPSNGNYV